MKIIGISGFAKSGKTSLMEAIKEEYNCKEISFASHLKNTCSKVFNIPREYFDDQKLKEKPISTIILSSNQIHSCITSFDIIQYDFDEIFAKHENHILTTPRYILQYIGTDILRQLDTDIHIKKAFSETEKDKNCNIFVVPDMRFMNEFSFVSQKGTTIGIIRDSVRPDLSTVHQSESFIDSIVEKCQYKIENNSSFEDFRERAKTLVKTII
jgi:hypothetical protein